MYLLGELSERLPGMRLRVEGSSIRGLVQQDDGWFAARIRTEPVAELFLTTRPTDGFELRIAWDKRGGIAIGDRELDDRFAIETNDDALARAWLDAPARAALLGSTYAFTTDDISMSELLELPVPVQRRTWTYELRRDELAVIKGSIEHDADNFATALTTAAILAARSRRWTAEYAAIARALDAHASMELELGGAPILTATRHAVDVAVQLLRNDGKHERLRTKVSAQRVGMSGDAMVLVSETIPWGAVPPLPRVAKRSSDLQGYRLSTSKHEVPRLDDVAKNLIGTAEPGVAIVDANEVAVWFDGAMQDAARLDAAIELVARWAVEGVVASGPYR